jgi:hypothetical protein
VQVAFDSRGMDRFDRSVLSMRLTDQVTFHCEAPHDEVPVLGDDALSFAEEVGHTPDSASSAFAPAVHIRQTTDVRRGGHPTDLASGRFP